MKKKSILTAKIGTFILVLTIVLFAFINFVSGEFSQKTNYLHYTETPITVGASTYTNRYMNETGVSGTRREEKISSDIIHDLYFYTSPSESYDLNLSGTVTVYLYMKVSKDGDNDADISTSVEIRDWDPDTETSTLIASASPKILNKNWNWYTYTMNSLNHIIDKDHRIILKVHPYVSGAGKKVDWFLRYDETGEESRILINTSQVETATNMTSPTGTVYGYLDRTFNMTCKARCEFGTCTDVNLLPQYCIGSSCTDYINMNSTTQLQAVSYTNTSIPNSQAFSKNISVTANTLGQYRIRCRSNASNALASNSTENQLVEIANVNITNIIHENIYEKSLSEYETQDTIDWINITASIFNATAGELNITLSLLDPYLVEVSWLGPETQACGNTAKDTTCEKKFDNSGSGYLIPLGEDGSYKIKAETIWDSGGVKENTSIGFEIHDLQSEFSSTLTDTKIINNESTVYNVSLYNLWSTNLTGVNITINCPDITGLNCTCLLSGQESQDYCDLENITTLSREWAPFNISTNASIPIGTYNINATINYTNPGGEVHNWTGEENRILSIVGNDILQTEIYNSPTEAIRGSSIDLKGFSNNLAPTPLNMSWLNWSYPSTWTLQSGTKDTFLGNVTSGQINWSNITVYIETTSILGQQEVSLESNNSQDKGDKSTIIVTVYASSQITNQQSNNTDPLQGESILISARLRYDNGSAIKNAFLVFNDTTEPQYLGSSLTGNLGWANVTYNIAEDAQVGSHTIKISYAGDEQNYIKPAFSNLIIDVHDIPVLEDITTSPTKAGYGHNITITADAYDEDGFSSTKVIITKPDMSTEEHDMISIGGNTYQYNYTVWKLGSYSYKINATDTAGFSTISSTYSFTGNSTLYLGVMTGKELYGPNEDVNISDYFDDWWNTTWNFRKLINVSKETNDRTNYAVTVNINLTQYLKEAYGTGTVDMDSVRISNTSAGTCTITQENTCAYQINGTSANASITFRVNISSNPYELFYLYFDNSSLDPPSEYLVYPKIAAGITNDVGEGNLPYFLDDTTRVYLNYTSGCSWTSANNNARCYDTTTTFPALDNYDAFMLEYYATAAPGFPDTELSANDDELQDWISSGGAYFQAVQNAKDISNNDKEYSTYTWVPGNPIINDKWKGGDNGADSVDDLSYPNHAIFSDPNAITSADIENIVSSAGQYSSDLFNFNLGTQPSGWTVLTTANDDDGGAFTVMIMEYLLDEGTYLISQHSTSSTDTATAEHYDFIENHVKYLTSFRLLSGSSTKTPELAENYNIISQIRNAQDTNNVYYLLMKIQENSTGTWQNLGTPVVDDVAHSNPRIILGNTRTSLAPIWDTAGSWNTQQNPGGYYKVYVSMRKQDGSILIDHNGDSLIATSIFRIISADLNLTEVEHENEPLQEYETTDTIDWINVTVTAYKATALSANITLNILDSLLNRASWGPAETKECGDLPSGTSCEKRFDNTGSGYMIPTDASEGTYTFYWNITMSWENGGDKENNSISFIIHNIADNLSSTLDDDRLQTGESTIYNTSIYNPWSTNLTTVNITVNCPDIIGLNCTCLIPGQESENYCDLVNVSNLRREWAPFNISTNASTTPGDYYINATINYTNPGGEIHSWTEKLIWLLKIRASGTITTTIVDYPAKITRASTFTNLTASANNTEADPILNTWLNWTLPYAWSGIAGEPKMFVSSLPTGVTWNNITAFINTSAPLGPGTILRFDTDNETFGDWDTVLVTIYANTTITNMTSSDGNPIQGESITLSAKLRYDNMTVIPNRLLKFNDTTDSINIGTVLTDALGEATIIYNIADTASVGNHTINISFAGYDPLYINPSWSNFSIWVHDTPKINEINITPQESGFGENITITANITDTENVSQVRARITYPDTTQIWYSLTEIVDNVWQLVFQNTWQKGLYSFYLEAKDIYDKITDSDTMNFTIGTESSTDVYQQKYEYYKNEDINITRYPKDWWNTTWAFRKPLTISAGTYTRTNYSVTLNINLSGYLSEAGGTGAAYLSSIRVLNTTEDSCLRFQGTCAYQIEGDENNANITFRVTIPQSQSYKYHIYFDNTSLSPPAQYLVYPRILAGDNNENIGDLDETLLPATARKYLNYTTGCSWTSASNMEKCFDSVTTGLGTYIMNDYDIFMLEYFAIEPSKDAIQYSDLNSKETEITNWVQAGGAYFSACQKHDKLPKTGDIGTYQWLPQDPTIHKDYDFDSANNAYILSLQHSIFTNPNIITETTLSAIEDGGEAGRDIFTFDAGDEPAGYTTLSKADDSTGTNKSLIIENTYGDGTYLLAESAVTVDDAVTEANVNFTENIVKYLTSFRKLNESSVSYELTEPYKELSRIRNKANYTINGYVIMKIQENSTGTWQSISTVVNDTQTSTLRTINAYQILYLPPIWNSSGGWNTQANPEGYYRIRTEFVDINGNMLYNSDNSPISNNSIFRILPPATKVDIIEIRIYNVTDAADNRTGGIFSDSGLNKTFNLIENTEYRIEIIVRNNDTSTQNWTIDVSKNITHNYLNSSWTIYTSDIWYNLSGEKQGGTWNGNVKWNSSLEGNLSIGSNMTFAYIVNVSAPYKDYPVKFLINDPDFNSTEYSTFRIVAPDSTPPELHLDIYGMTSYHVNRGSQTTIYSRWNEEIASANISYNSTESTVYNNTIVLSDPNPENWANQTLTPDEDWLLGPHVAKIYAEDLQDNLNGTLEFLNFDVWGWAKISEGNLSPDSIYITNATTIKCRVLDDNTSLAIIGYSVDFYNSTGYMGSNTTGISGWGYWTFNDYSGGIENITCNITDMESKYYNDTQENFWSHELFTGETSPPKYYEYGQNISIVHRGEYILYYANWSDDSELNYAWLESNETGILDNNTLSGPLYLGSGINWSNFSIQMTPGAQLGLMEWRIWANDTSANQNKTPFLYTEIWGSSALSQADMKVEPSTILVTNTTTVYCRVIDEDTGTPLSGYNVTFEFDNSTGDPLIIESNITNSSGWAMYKGGDTLSNDTYDVYCMIDDNATAYYNRSSSAWISSGTLVIANPGEDKTAPYLYDNTYNLNDSTITRGADVLAYARWNETVDGARIWYNMSSLGVNLYNYSITLTPPNLQNWTNYTIETNSSWIIGTHNIKIDAKDPSGNWNTSLWYLNLDVYADISVYWISPQTSIYRGNNNLTCRVTADDNNEPIESYTVTFYNGTNDWIGTRTTNESGFAVLEFDSTSYTTGTQTFKCIISNSGFYEATTTQATRNIEVKGTLNTTTINPPDGIAVHIGNTINLNSTTKDEFGNPVTPTDINWSNTTDIISTLENDTWSIPYTHSKGPEIISINTTKASYEDGYDNITIYVWGYSNISWQSPAPSSNYSQGSTIPLICKVFDNYTNGGIENYTVNFYLENETQTWYLDESNTTSTGNATYNWHVDPAVYANGTYYPKCNISGDPNVYYNMSAIFEDNTTVNITISEITGAFEVSLIIPPELSTTEVAQYRNLTVNATVKCINGACGEVNGTLQYSNQSIACTTIPQISGAPFHINDGTQNPKTCGNMLENDECNLSWIINATGPLDSIYNISTLFTGTQSEDNRTQNATIEIKYLLIATITPDSISTWYEPPQDGDTNYNSEAAANWLDPGTDGAQASSAVTVSLSEYSSDANSGIWILGANLTSITPSDYHIPANNMSGCTGNLTDYPTPNSASACLSNPANELREHYTQFDTDLKSGESKQFVLFLDIPFGISSQVDGYKGTIWVKVNGTA